ncbi:MAG: Fic family protein [Desulfatitalea sp.]|nr:Fic family protein [Desulfatitalea sp.]NNJ99332.1 Fic family protein [Desulfatitalea sp.]
MVKYIHQWSDWPDFRWDNKRLADKLAAVRYRQGLLIGKMASLGFPLRAENALNTMALDVLKSSEIEGEILDREQVRSSIARRLGVDIGPLAPVSRNIEGVVDMMFDATRNHTAPLTTERLFGWHAALFPTGYSGMSKIKVGSWRDDANGPMQVVSGPIGRYRLHFEAPAADRLKDEVAAFLYWFDRTDDADGVLRAGVAHLWFVTIHPFADGNGRIARAITDMELSRSEKNDLRFYSMSAQIQKERDLYYKQLEHAQKGTLDITDWLQWFLECLDRTFDNVDETVAHVLKKARFWEACAGLSINDRQKKVLNMLLDGLDGKLTSSKWAKLSKCSQDTALRDIVDLIDKELLAKGPGGGRNTSYSLVEP